MRKAAVAAKIIETTNSQNLFLCENPKIRRFFKREAICCWIERRKKDGFVNFLQKKQNRMMFLALEIVFNQSCVLTFFLTSSGVVYEVKSL